MAERKTSDSENLLRFVKNVRQAMDGRDLLAGLRRDSAALVFLDPQYRAVLDQMKFGNEGVGRQRKRAALASMDDAAIAFFIRGAAIALKPSGHIALWMDKFSLASGRYHSWLHRAGGIELGLMIVDLLAWNKMRPGMGRRLRCVTEYCLIVQKPPIRAKEVWLDRGMRDSWSEMSDREIHPHAKPRVWTERLIRAVTKRGDLVVDPCAGGYGVLDACRASGRDFMGCDVFNLKGSSSR